MNVDVQLTGVRAYQIHDLIGPTAHAWAVLKLQLMHESLAVRRQLADVTITVLPDTWLLTQAFGTSIARARQ